MKKSNKGITLVTLAITIIVILILAGISVSMIVGENGIIHRAHSARAENEKADADEQLNVAVLSSRMNSSDDAEIDLSKLQKQLNKLKKDKVIDDYSPSDNFSLPVIAEKGNYKFKIDGEGNVKQIVSTQEDEDIQIANWQKPTSDEERYIYSYGGDEVNAPKLKGNMKLIEYTGDLSNESNIWANAITSDGSMWVWIPRYAYKITSGYTKTKIHQSNKVGTDNELVEGTIDVKFIDTENNFLDGTKEELVTNPASITYDANGRQNEWLVHPAFTSDTVNGGWDSELEGIWVAKFEATGTYDSLSVKPGVASLRNIKINDAYKLAKSSTFGEKLSAEELGSHMAKNSEWGAVAYLAHSKYGRNGKLIGKNTSEYHYTGGSDSQDAIYTENSNQSTTGNATGIYDMNGGAWEFVAMYVNYRNGKTSDSYKAWYPNNGGECILVKNGGGTSSDLYGGDQTTRTTSTKYKTVYASDGQSNSEAMILSYKANSDKKGDAIYETSSGTGKNASEANTTNSWFKQLSIYTNYGHPFLKRGGNWDSDSTGIFFFNNATGEEDMAGSFRPILAF